ncbi:MAG: hypothetical protein QG658_513 [Patescibacteria group bacterium]|nr:hypothetical protein [Patescibacteria group bacterium]
MARKLKRKDDWGRLVGLVIFLWFLILTSMGNLFGQLGLGMLLFVGGIWTLARSKNVWEEYRADWKKLPKSQRTQWNEPKEVYYYINLLVLIPLSIALGLALIFLSFTALI